MTKINEMEVLPVAVIGGGAAGMMSAISCAELGVKTFIFEKNTKMGMKLGITGKGRCNITNSCNVQEFLQNVPLNPRFLYTALTRFSPDDSIHYFESIGVPLKVERGRRVFPVSDKAHDVVNAMVSCCRDLGVSVIYETVLNIRKNNSFFEIQTNAGKYCFFSVIVATGGCSYPATGSTGDGYGFAKKLGHTVTSIYPSLVPLIADKQKCLPLQGLSLKNVSLKVTDKQTGKIVYNDFGEMLFTHFGISGPMVLSGSAHLNFAKSNAYTAHVDFKPALSEKELDTRVLSDFEKYINRDIINALNDLLPQKAIPVIVKLSGIDERKKVHDITQKERMQLIHTIKSFDINIQGPVPIKDAIVTRGGVEIKQINPQKMESKLVENLYFAGEIIDVDGYTGGYNLQIAFSTGKLAGESAANKYKELYSI